MIILHCHGHNVQAVSELGDFLAHLPELIYYYICSHMIHTSIEGRTRTCHAQQWPTPSKYMRNEIWSLMSFAGAPSWFITFSPADNMHPISLNYADTKEEFTPELKGYDERYRLIAENPVAGARFFDMVVKLFIKHVLGVNSKHAGLYGDTEAYYGTVEQQGRLTLTHAYATLAKRKFITSGN